MPLAVLSASANSCLVVCSSFLVACSCCPIALVSSFSEAAEKSRGQIAITDTDIARIPEVVTHYDAIRTDLKTEQGARRIAYAKQADDGVIVYVEDVGRKRQDLRGVTMWKFPPGADANLILKNVLEVEENKASDKAKARKDGLLADALSLF